MGIAQRFIYALTRAKANLDWRLDAPGWAGDAPGWV